MEGFTVFGVDDKYYIQYIMNDIPCYITEIEVRRINFTLDKDKAISFPTMIDAYNFLIDIMFNMECILGEIIY